MNTIEDVINLLMAHHARVRNDMKAMEERLVKEIRRSVNELDRLK